MKKLLAVLLTLGSISTFAETANLKSSEFKMYSCDVVMKLSTGETLTGTPKYIALSAKNAVARASIDYIGQIYRDGTVFAFKDGSVVIKDIVCSSI